MSNRTSLCVGLIAALLLGVALPATADEAVDKAFEALKTYDWGQERAVLQAIDDAVVGSHDDDAAQKALEERLAAVLATDASGAAKDYVCRQLSLIGTAASVPAVAELLTDKKLSHMGRYALERMPCDEALAALRAALGKTEGMAKVGVINSLGVRRDAAGVSALTGLLKDSDKQVAAAAAAALGNIGNADAAKALADCLTTAPDACLCCAERLLAGGDKAGALAIYVALSKADVPKHVQVAATRGRIAAMRAKTP